MFELLRTSRKPISNVVYEDHILLQVKDNPVFVILKVLELETPIFRRFLLNGGVQAICERARCLSAELIFSIVQPYSTWWFVYPPYFVLDLLRYLFKGRKGKLGKACEVLRVLGNQIGCYSFISNNMYFTMCIYLRIHP